MAVFVVQLDDKVSAPAESAAAAVGSLSEQFEALQKQLSAVEQMQASAFKAHDATAYKAPSESNILDDIKKQQQAALAGHDQDRDAAEGLRKQQEAAAATRKEFEALTASGAEMSPTLDALALKAEKLGGALAIGVAIITAYAAALYKLASAAISLTQEKDQLEATFDVFTEGAGGQLLDELEDLAATLPFTADKLNAWAKSLLAAGIKGEALKTSIKAIAAATAIMGEQGGQAAQNLIKRFALMAETGQKVSLDRKVLSQLAEAGVSVQALAKQLGVAPEKLSEMKLGAKELGEAMQKALIAQGAGPLAKLGTTWESISAKIKEGIEDAFEDLDDLVGPFMREVQSLASEFFAGSIASKDFAGVIKGVLTPAFEVATEMVRWLHVGFLEAQIAILKVRIALAPVTGVLRQIGVSAGVVNVALYVLKGTVIVLAVAVGLLAVAVALVALPFIIAGLAIYGVVRAVQYLIGLFGQAADSFDNIKAKASETASGIVASVQSVVVGAASALAGFPLAAAEAGLNFVLGLVQAITTGQGPVADAARALARSAVSAIKGALGISSPSKVMIGMGGYTTAGLVQGITGGEGDVERAAQGAGMAAVSGVDAGLSQGGGVAGAGGKARAGLVVEAGGIAITINGNGNGDANETRGMVEEALAILLERLAAKAGV